MKAPKMAIAKREHIIPSSEDSWRDTLSIEDFVHKSVSPASKHISHQICQLSKKHGYIIKLKLTLIYDEVETLPSLVELLPGTLLLVETLDSTSVVEVSLN